MTAVVQPNLFGVEQTERTSDDYYTPAHVFAALGLEFDLDVCAPPDGPPCVPAERWFTKEDDGLSQPWSGRVWMNPPYSHATPWVRKFITHRHGVALLPHAKSAWHIQLLATDAATTEPGRYWNFIGGSIPYPVFFAAFGDECVEALRNIGPIRVLG